MGGINPLPQEKKSMRKVGEGEALLWTCVAFQMPLGLSGQAEVASWQLLKLREFGIRKAGLSGARYHLGHI